MRWRSRSGWASDDDAKRFAASRDQFRADLYASLRRGGAAARHRLPARRRGTRRFRCDLDHHRAGAGRRAGQAAAGAAAQHLRALLARVRAAPRRHARVEGLHALRAAQRRQPSCAWAGASARTRRCDFFFKDRAAAGLEPVGRSGLAHAAQAVLPRRPAACLGGVGLRALGAGHVRLHARSRRQRW